MHDKNKKVIIFDLDGTLAESKQPLDEEMSELLASLMLGHLVGIASGGSIEQFHKQFLPFIKKGSRLSRLILLPTSGASMYEYVNNNWKLIYEKKLSLEDFKKIKKVLTKAYKKVGIVSKKSYGELIEYRGSQVTFSALGQNAPLEEKEVWDPNQEKRKEIVKLVENDLEEFEIRIGGTTSIDINRKGIDKAYGIKKLSEISGINISEMLYVGDALYEGGNDSAVIKSGIDIHPIENVAETKEFIKSLI